MSRSQQFEPDGSCFCGCGNPTTPGRFFVQGHEGNRRPLPALRRTYRRPVAGSGNHRDLLMVLGATAAALAVGAAAYATLDGPNLRPVTAVQQPPSVAEPVQPLLEAPQPVQAAVAPAQAAPEADPGCHPAYIPCLPIRTDMNCPAVGQQVALRDPSVDPYHLDADGDGLGCVS